MQTMTWRSWKSLQMAKLGNGIEPKVVAPIIVIALKINQIGI